MNPNKKSIIFKKIYNINYMDSKNLEVLKIKTIVLILMKHSLIYVVTNTKKMNAIKK